MTIETKKRETIELWQREAEENLKELGHIPATAKDQRRIIALCERVLEIEKALRFYADRENYDTWGDRYSSRVESDEGDTAREALGGYGEN